MRILITGSRKWTNREIIKNAIIAVSAGSNSVTVVHGDCPYGGADTIAAEIANSLSMEVESHPADWKGLGKAAGPIRNQEMVNLGADVCLAFPMTDSRGTIDCMNRARQAHIPLLVFNQNKEF